MYLKNVHILSKRLVYILSTLVFLGGTTLYGYRAFATPLPLATISIDTLTPPTIEAVNLLWPGTGQGALGSLTEGVVARSSSDDTPRPIASIAKIITSLAVLEKMPLKQAETGPTLTLTQADVDIYKDYVSAGGSVVRVEAGENITERQMIEGMLLPSANNLADSLAVWAFGSVDAYATYANNLLKAWGIHNTTVRDASGFSDTTTSTASDLVLVGQKALMNPVLAVIVSEKEAIVPVAGKIRNTNLLLNNGGVGIKTGHTNEAGACLLFAAQYVLNEHETITIIGSLIGQSDMEEVFTSASAIITASKKGFIERTIVKKGEHVASYTTEWGASSSIIAAESLRYVGWYETPLPISVIIRPVQTIAAQEEGGVISIRAHNKQISVPAIADNDVGTPSALWRLKHGLEFL